MSQASTEHPVTVIIPIYRGKQQTQQCVESVLNSLPDGASLMLVNDCSPEPELVAYCREVAAAHSLILLENAENLGFVGSVNKAMQQAGQQDVVLLNSDTEVAGEWLQCLQRAAYGEDKIATVTPFSNNATICSYPEFCAENAMPQGLSTQAMQALVQAVNAGRVVEIPTAVGFCMYIRRACLDDIGVFDAEAFGKGYGEENDFCLRASQAGWQHLLAADCFVYHEGSVSFLTEKTALTQHAEAVIRARYPDYFPRVQQFIQDDPILPLRQRIDRVIGLLKPASPEAIDYLARIMGSTKPRLLFISHGWGGGVGEHIDVLKRSEHYHVICLKGQGNGGVTLSLSPAGLASVSIDSAGFDEQNREQWQYLLDALQVSRIHVHHLHGWPKQIVNCLLQLAVPIDITVHDYYLLSPNYHQTADGPRCDEASWPQSDADWQQVMEPLVRAAQRVIVPSAQLASEVKAVYPFAAVLEKAHPERVMQHAAIKKVVLLGALSNAKGLRAALDVSRLAQQQAPNLQFELIGYPTTPVEAPLAIHGEYRQEELPRLLAASKADAIWFPAQVPESYSFALTYAMATGLPIVASDIGALPQRLQHYAEAHIVAPEASAEQWLAVIRQVVAYRPQENVPYVDSIEAYGQWYCEPLPAAVAAVKTDILDILTVLHALPEQTPPQEKPLKSLYEFAVHARHAGALQEVARKLQVLDDLETEVVGLQQHLKATEGLHNGRAEFDRVLQESREEIKALSVEVKALSEENALLSVHLENSREDIAQFQEQGRNAQAHINHLEERLQTMLNSTSWKVTLPLRGARRVVTKLLSVARALIKHILRPASHARLLDLIRRRQWRTVAERVSGEIRSEVSRGLVSERAKQQEQEKLAEFERLVEVDEILQPVSLASSATPLLSIVIPVYGKHVTTYQCLKSIAAHPPGVPYEVIIADDCSPEPAAEALAVVEGVRFCRGAENLGFVGNMNAGAAQARGEYLVLLNNDTIVCEGAFDHLLATFDEHRDVGMVGAKLLGEDGSLQEAGGIIWRDGSGWNWGRGQHISDPRFNYVRDVDYCSGAVLAISRHLFMEMGGFDELYKPAYYEDTDLAFRIRKRGLRVLYQPAAEVFHIEGVSHGRDENSGVKAHLVTNKEKFRERWRDVLATHNENAEDPDNECHRYTKGNVLVIEACMITPDQDSGSVRMLNLLKLLREEGYHVTFVADNLEYRENVVNQLNSMGIEVLYEKWAGSVRQVIRKLGPSLHAVFISRHYIASQYDALVRAIAPQAKLIFDTVDLHFVREEREAELDGNEALKAQAAVTKRKEMDLIHKSDITLVVSEFEQQLLAEIAPEARVEIVSNIHSHTPQRPDYAQREGILFVGGFRHPPNVDAMLWYSNNILPHVQELLPGVVTTVIGSNMPDSIKALASDHMRVLGFVEDIEPELHTARVSIAPLRYGAGVKGKVNEAMNHGIPVVATPCAVEGMHTTDGEDVLVAETPRTFAEAIARVYSNGELWQRISDGGIKNVESHFSPDAARPAIQRILS